MSKTGKMIALGLAGAALMLMAPALAQSGAQPNLPVVDQLYACRAITDAAQRLTCYDNAVAAVQTAVQSRDIRIIDRHTAERADVALARPEPIQTVDSTISSARRNGDGGLTLALANGQIWVQVDSRTVSTPNAGTAVHIYRTSFGGYFANVANRPGFRVRQNR